MVDQVCGVREKEGGLLLCSSCFFGGFALKTLYANFV